MNAFRIVAVATAVVAATTTGAMSTDLYDVVTPAGTEEPYDWSGFYVGKVVGYAWGNKDVADAEEPDETGAYVVSGWLKGIEAGVNWQSGAFVIGFEGDAVWVNASGGGLIDGDDPISTEINFLATLTKRVGIAGHGVLLYLEGGGAWVSEEHTLIGDDGAGPSDTVSDNRFGGLLGVGLEFALQGNWSLKAEYNHIWLGTREFTFVVDEDDVIDISQTLQTFKIGLNYRF